MSPAQWTWVVLALDVTTKATIVLIAAWVATRFARRAPSAARHMIWMVALGTLLVLPGLEIVAPRATFFTLPAAPVDPASISSVAPSMPEQDFADIPTLPDVPPVIEPVKPANPLPWLGGAWIVGSFAVLLSALGACVLLQRIQTRSIPLPATLLTPGGARGVRLKVSREGRPPGALTWGCLRPTILLPRSAEEWSQERFETVLLHELEHVRRWDAAMQYVGIGACALYWFHPGVWLAARAARSEAEAATDDAVLRRGIRPSAYANTLMEVAAEIGRRPHLASMTGVAFMKRSKIEARLRAILDGRTRRGVTGAEKVIAGALAAAILVPLAFVRAAAIEPTAALPGNADPLSDVQVAAKPTATPLTQKQLAARRAHHLRALAALRKLHRAPNITIVRIDGDGANSGLTSEQFAQAKEAGQLKQAVASTSAEYGSSSKIALPAVAINLNGLEVIRPQISSSVQTLALPLSKSIDLAVKAAYDPGALKIQLDSAQTLALKERADALLQLRTLSLSGQPQGSVTLATPEALNIQLDSAQTLALKEEANAALQLRKLSLPSQPQGSVTFSEQPRSYWLDKSSTWPFPKGAATTVRWKELTHTFAQANPYQNGGSTQLDELKRKVDAQEQTLRVQEAELANLEATLHVLEAKRSALGKGADILARARFVTARAALERAYRKDADSQAVRRQYLDKKLLDRSYRVRARTIKLYQERLNKELSKKRRAELEQRRLELVARLKQIESELNKKPE